MLKKYLHIIILLIVLFSVSNVITAQNYALVLNNNPYIVLNNGSSGTPIYLVVNQSQTTGIYSVVPASPGHIISEGEFNYVDWVISNGTGTYTLPFYDKTNTTQIPFSMNIANAGAAGASNHILFSTYESTATLTPYATYNGVTTIHDMNLEYTANPRVRIIQRM